MGKKRHKAAPWMCGQCKAGFESQAAVRHHIAGAHPTIHNCGVFRCVERIDGPEYEESYADRTIAAMQAVEAGEHTDDKWLLG